MESRRVYGVDERGQRDTGYRTPSDRRIDFLRMGEDATWANTMA